MQRRFFRAVHLGADATREDACDGYVVTAVARASLVRIVEGSAPSHHQRAWSITGPYGVGKSAFAVFLAQYLGRARGGAVGLPAVAVPWVTALATATFGSLVDTLLTALEGAAAGLNGAERFVASVARLRKRSAKGEAVQREVLGLVESLVSLAAEAGRGGVLLVLDELGKMLDFAARGQHPTDEVFLLQELAEFAARSGNCPLVIVTLLHQSFDRYAKRIGAEARAEWAKVQGRFEDVAFVDAPSELLRLAAASLARGTEPTPGFFTHYDDLAREAVSMGLAESELEPTLALLAPIHPSVALVLPALFRGPLVQNERSLFDFLTSSAEGAMGAFLASEESEARKSYTLDRLYDFVTATLGLSQFAGAEGRRWATLDEALGRLGVGASALSVRLVKTIGMLTLLGSRSLCASRAVLRFALGGAEVDAALDALVTSSQVVFRRHSDSYVLWEGSDIDLDARFDEARQRAPGVEALAEAMRAKMLLRPRVARRHFYETGTLRHFEVTLSTPDDATRALVDPPERADGRMVYLLPAGDESAEDLLTFAIRRTVSPQVVVGVPTDVRTLMEGARTWHAWEAVRARGGDLSGDAVARRELAARLRIAEGELDASVEQCFGRFDLGGTAWVRAGHRESWRGARGVMGGLSAVCDEVYALSPRLRNELLNRHALSAAAAAARRALLDAMVGAGDKVDLGLEGTPPERGMYESLLKAGGLHRVRDGCWGFGAPTKDDPLRLRPTWEAIEAFLDGGDGEALPVDLLVSQLAMRPYGVRGAVVPVLLLAVVLSAPGAVAFFEDGTFVPELTSAVVERLLRRVDHFTVARYRVSGARSEMLARLAPSLGVETTQPIDLVRALVRKVATLPRFVRTTRALGPLALAVRETVLAARDPLKLLFVDLPRALGEDSLDASTEAGGEVVMRVVSSLAEALRELSGAYRVLLKKVETRLADAFQIEARGEALRASVTPHAARCLTVAVDLRLRAFLGRAAATEPGDLEWIEGVAMVVGNRPPSEWSDSEFGRFAQGLEEVKALLRRAESLLESAPTATGVAPEDQAAVDEAEREILMLLESRLSGRPDTWRAALGRTLQRLNAPPGEDQAVRR
ncbi:MAG: hypothetical protein JNK72_23680 [Myxococcales bacterium]|nr:hypothetical protein [Myxococcales bacterium]